LEKSNLTQAIINSDNKKISDKKKFRQKVSPTVLKYNSHSNKSKVKAIKKKEKKNNSANFNLVAKPKVCQYVGSLINLRYFQTINAF
jgi:hypothetical protein